MTLQQVVQTARSSGVRLVRFLYCDNGCTIRGKLTHIDGLASRMRTGIGITVAMQAQNMLDQLQPVEGMGPVGEIRLVPDADTFKLLPFAPHSAAMVADMLTLEGQAWGACPRSFLKRTIARAADHGLVVQSALENEFTLCREVEGRMVPVDESLCFSSIGMHESAVVIDDMVAAFEAMAIPVEHYYPELGHGQHELSVRHAEALMAADHQVFYREAVRGVARNHGLYASLAPKPFPDQAGNGCHIHISLWDPTGMQNLLWSDGGRYNLSDLGYHFIAGILAHLPALVALTAPSFNSYRRLRPHMWASAFTAWGPDNREAAIRVVAPLWQHEPASINFELKSSDPSNNPYLALGGLIAAGLDGVERKLDPGEPVLVDPGDLSDEERARRGIRPLPSTQAEALDNLERDDLLMEALGPMLATSYLAVKRSEYRAFAGKDVDFEVKHHFFKF